MTFDPAVDLSRTAFNPLLLLKVEDIERIKNEIKINADVQLGRLSPGKDH